MRATPIILSVSVLLASGSAQGANWQKVSKETSVDPATVKRSGSLARVVWLRERMNTRVGNAVIRSAVAESEFDCGKHRFRSLHYTAYAQSGGKGEEVKFDNKKLWLQQTDWSGMG